MAKLRRKGLPANAGEAIVLETLACELPDDYLVLANINLYERQFLPEVDAVVIHARALFALEIKDLHGKLEWAGPGNDWLHNGHSIADPYQQAENAAKKLSKYLRYERARQIFEDERAAGSIWVQPVLVIVDPATDTSNVANVSNVKLCHLRDLPQYLTTCHSQFHRTNFKPQEIERVSETLGLKLGTTVPMTPISLPPELPTATLAEIRPQDKPSTPRKPAAPVRCRKCGWNNSPKSRFCGQCGAMLVTTAPVLPRPIVQAQPAVPSSPPEQSQPVAESQSGAPPQSELSQPTAPTPPHLVESQFVALLPQPEPPQPIVEVQPGSPVTISQLVTLPPLAHSVETIPLALAVSKCAQCDTENKPTARFCIKCGVALPQLEAPRACPQCQAENKPSAHFCRTCGAKL